MATSRVPNANLGFFENYQQHVNALLNDYSNTNKVRTEEEHKNYLADKCSTYFKAFDPLYDEYDFADEVAGATIVPLTLSAVSIICLVAGIWESIHQVAIDLGIVENNIPDGVMDLMGDLLKGRTDRLVNLANGASTHGENAFALILIALISAILAIVSFVKSAVSIITRPIVTALDECGPDEATFDRFDDGIEMAFQV